VQAIFWQVAKFISKSHDLLSKFERIDIKKYTLFFISDNKYN